MNLARTLLASLSLALAAPAATAQRSASLFVEGGRWFDVESRSFRDNPGLWIEDGTIRSVGGAVEPPEGVPVLRLEDDHHVLPGFVDLHAHYNVSLLNVRREEFDVMPVQYLANGVTLTFSAGEYDPEGMLELREALERGEKLGPRLVTSGPYFGRARRGWHGDPDAIEAEVELWASRGAGGFKAKGIDAACLEALIAAAHARGLTVTGHLGSGADGSVNPSDAIDMGIDRVEHFLGGEAMDRARPAYDTLGSITADSPGFDAIVAKFIEHGVVFVPTITAFGYFGDGSTGLYESWFDEASLLTDTVREVLEEVPITPERIAIQSMRDTFQEIHAAKLETIDDYWRAGGVAGVGTDVVCRGRFLPGFGYHRELEALARSGIPAAEVLRMATLEGARALGLDGRHGALAVGKVGDLVVVSGDPGEDITRTRHIAHVVRAGVVHDPRALLEGVRGRLGPASEDELDQW